MQIYYLLKCRCKWWRKCRGTTDELKDLVEHKPCVNCHGPRKFKCPKCGQIVKAMRLEEPDPPEMKETSPSAKTTPPMESQALPPAQEPDRTDLAKELGRLLARRLRGGQ